MTSQHEFGKQFKGRGSQACQFNCFKCGQPKSNKDLESVDGKYICQDCRGA